jgi:hypothetical protein
MSTARAPECLSVVLSTTLVMDSWILLDDVLSIVRGQRRRHERIRLSQNDRAASNPLLRSTTCWSCCTDAMLLHMVPAFPF